MSESTFGTFGRTIQLFLVDGMPNGLMVASIHGWTGSVLVATQATFARLLARPEVERTGVYILYGPDPENAALGRAYIGEGESVGQRIGQSAGSRDFWESAVVITTSDDVLTKGHIQYLEARLIADAKSAGRVTLDNGTLPDAGKRRLPEADRANMESFLANLRVVLPVIGLDMLKPQSTIARPAARSEEPAQEAKFELRHKSGISAFAIEEDGEFVVLKGSEALKDAGFTSNSYGSLREGLMKNGTLQIAPSGDRYLFTSSHTFRSPSAAAATVLDRNANGRLEWCLPGTKTTYADWQDQSVKKAKGTEN
jgi:hypothetical protein